MDTAQLTHIAARQHGVVGRRQLLTAGATPGQVASLVRDRHVDVLACGVYGLPDAPVTPLREAMVAALRGGPGTRVAGERMLAAFGVDLPADGPFVALVPPGTRVGQGRWEVRADRHPALGDPTDVAGVPSFGLARNLLEACASAPTVAHAEALSGLVHDLDPTAIHEVGRLAHRMSRHAGVHVLGSCGVLA